MPEIQEESGSSPHEPQKTWFCPSAQPGLTRSVIFGVVSENDTSEPQISYLDRLAEVTQGTILAAAGPVRLTRLFRFAAPCEQSRCRNWSGATCRVAERLVQILPVMSSHLPDCPLRVTCRWFDQEGAAACLRCPQAVTDHPAFEMALNATCENAAPQCSASDCNADREA
jgi:hypothetical protein